MPCTLIGFAKWFEANDRQVAFDEIGGVRLSTVFLGLDHNFCPEGPPLLFETMTFGGGWEVCERYATWDEAEAGHARWRFTLTETLLARPECDSDL